ncbi:spore maturation protein [candidate division KSB1 bacterium]|nr:spore maturation protein [candidate division KSB1 bacterium]
MSDGFALFSDAVARWSIPVILLLILGIGALKRVRVYESFVGGAKEGFNVALRIIPYLVAMLVAIGMFRASGALEFITSGLAPVLAPLGVPPEVLPMMLIMPLSGSGAQGVLAEGLKTYGPDTLLGNMLSVLNGSNETTFYIIAVYFGSVAIRNIRHALPAALIGNIAGFAVAVALCNLLFG